MRSLTVVDAPLVADLIGRMHWSVVDDQGGSLVLEYIDGVLQTHDNSQVRSASSLAQSYAVQFGAVVAPLLALPPGDSL